MFGNPRKQFYLCVEKFVVLNPGWLETLGNYVKHNNFFWMNYWFKTFYNHGFVFSVAENRTLYYLIIFHVIVWLYSGVVLNKQRMKISAQPKNITKWIFIKCGNWVSNGGPCVGAWLFYLISGITVKVVYRNSEKSLVFTDYS